MGAAAFWLANLAVSATPVATSYRAALSIPYLPMLAEAAAGGLVLGCAVAFPVVHYPSKIPGTGPLSQALLLGAMAVVLLTLGLELPSKLTSDVDDPMHWLWVAAVFNMVRIFALAATIGLFTATGQRRRDHRGTASGRNRE